MSVIRYEKLQGVRVGNSPLPAIKITEEGRAMGHVPKWDLLIQPDYVRNGAPVNRAGEGVSAVDNGPVKLGTFPNGQKSFRFNQPAAEGREVIYPNASFNTDAWSLTMAIEIKTANLVEFAVSSPRAVTGQLGVRFTRTSSGDIAIYDGSSSTARCRFSTSPASTAGPVVVTFTFSVKNGLAIYLNGSKVAENIEDKRPLTAGNLSGQWALGDTPSFVGEYGHVCLVGVDLNDPAHYGDRLAIEDFLMTKYGIVKA